MSSKEIFSQESPKQPSEDRFEQEELKQEVMDGELMQEFQKEEEEGLSSKDKKEKPTQSRWKRALCAMTAGLILFGSAEAGFAGVAGVTGEGKINYSQENSPVSIKNQLIEKEAAVIDQVEITPEFQRNMEKVLLSVDQFSSPEEIRKIYHDLLVTMPDYSVIQVLAGKEQAEKFLKIIDEIQEQEKCDLRQRLQIIPTNDKLEMWAQDFGEMAKINGKDTFIISAGRG